MDGSKKRATTPVAFELETEAVARRRRERREQRGARPPPLRAQQTLARAKSTHEHARLHLRQLPGAALGAASAKVLLAPAAAVRPQPAPPPPQSAREAPSLSLRAALDRRRPQSAKAVRQRDAATPGADELVTGTRVHVRHWEAWLCRPTPTTRLQLAASQSSPLLRGGGPGAAADAAAGPGKDLEDESAPTARRTSIVVDMRRLRVGGDADAAAGRRWAWGGAESATSAAGR